MRAVIAAPGELGSTVDTPHAGIDTELSAVGSGLGWPLDTGVDMADIAVGGVVPTLYLNFVTQTYLVDG